MASETKYRQAGGSKSASLAKAGLAESSDITEASGNTEFRNINLGCNSGKQETEGSEENASAASGETGEVVHPKHTKWR